jgi:hypothetical protein
LVDIRSRSREDGDMAAGFRLGRGDIGPIQQSPVTCGSASLTVARMLVNSEFARWIVSGEGARGDAPGGATEAERFAGYERVVMKRTNGLFAGGHRLNLPWPHALGTPPWGAKKELEFGASRPGTQYDTVLLGLRGSRGLGRCFDRLVEVVTEGEPALLYIGNRWMPRHVTLVLPGDGSAGLDVYDPASGVVDQLRRDAFTSRSLGIAGWNVPWIAVQADGLRKVQAYGFATAMAPASRPSGVVSA